MNQKCKHDKLLHLSTGTVWAAMSAQGIIDSYFFKLTEVAK